MAGVIPLRGCKIEEKIISFLEPSYGEKRIQI